MKPTDLVPEIFLSQSAWPMAADQTSLTTGHWAASTSCFCSQQPIIDHQLALILHWLHISCQATALRKLKFAFKMLYITPLQCHSPTFYIQSDGSWFWHVVNPSQTYILTNNSDNDATYSWCWWRSMKIPLSVRWKCRCCHLELWLVPRELSFEPVASA